MSAQTITFQCGAKNEPFLDKANRLVLAQLALTPVEANQIGLHEYEGKSLDDQLDDFSPAALGQARALLKAGRSCFDTYKNLAPEDNADLIVLRDSIDAQLFQLDRMQAYKYQPQIYVEMIGSGMFFPLTESNGTEQQRLQSIVARMEKIPAALAQAKNNLVEADPVFIETAVQENDGNKGVIELVGQKISAKATFGGYIGTQEPKGDVDKQIIYTPEFQRAKQLEKRFEEASTKATAAIDDFSRWLKDDLGKRPHHRTWRTDGLYPEIFRYSLGPGAKETPQTVLAAAERELARIREQMLNIATPVHAKWFPGHGDHAKLPPAERLNTIVSEVIGRINDDHTTPDHLLDEVRSQAKTIRQFIIDK
ncbi:MAG: DUF885 family protein, partial [Actinomycetota bacterium]